jgi:NADPH-dependent curcumin reductase CurA
LRSRPQNVPEPDDFGIVEVDVPEPGENEVLVRNLYFSMEPATRTRLDPEVEYMPPIGIGEAIQSPTVGRVVRSNHPAYGEGDILYGYTNWDDYVVVSDDTMLLDRLHPETDLPLSYYVGALGGSGLAAHVGLHDIGQLRAGETVVVSAAAGAVGSVAGQIARIRGCTVVGLVGSADKAQIVTGQLGFDVAINYRETPDLAAAVREACPDGVDLYFDNVGGSTLDAMLVCMNTFGRIVACGMVSGYNQQSNPPAIYHLWEVVARQLRIQGFLLPAHADSVPNALRDLHAWARSGDLVILENISRGIHQAPECFCSLLGGTTIGKTLLELDDADSGRPAVDTVEQAIT